VTHSRTRTTLDSSFQDVDLLPHLLACILALKAGRPEACLPLLIEMYERHGGQMGAVMPEVGADTEEPYAWDTCYADDPCGHDQPCR